ncbi:Hypothetical predicted protein [Olea europaea subsp. europaea]|uniref:Uncharacterized protein n=1 Tax=Olea europaea subsp. europaea TaxID=158383 RepID=A0A8S0Q731_OLEEU|nr:Hypothetical predicted protein [Olea europaea subsp. europaea]
MASSCSCPGLLQPNFSKGFQPLGSHRLHYHPTISNLKNGGSFLGDQSLKYIQSLRTNNGSKRRELVVEATPDPEVGNHLLSFWPTDNPWFAGVAGFMVTVPFLAQRLLTLTKEVDLAAQTVEKIADAVEKVAEEVDKAAENIAESLPEGALKNVVNLVEDLAEETAKDAQKVEDLMDKIEEIDDKVEAYFSNQSKDNPSV